MFTFLVKMYRFPCHVWFIIASKGIDTSDSFALVGLLYLFVTAMLKINETQAADFSEVTLTLTIVTNFVTAYVADSRIGKFRVLVFGCVLQVIGFAMLTFSSVCASYKSTLAYATGLTWVSVIIRALGGGAVVPTLPTFGGDQFDATQQDLLPTYFITLYLIDKVGSVIGLIIGPKLRALPCLNEHTCFPLAFGQQTVFSTLMLIVLLAGVKLYVYIQPQKNGVVQAIKFASQGLYRVIRRRLLRVASVKSFAPPTQLADTHHVLRMFLLFTPFPCFWALQQQQNNRWIYQGKRMDGDVFGERSLLIEPEQMELAGPLLAIILIPVFDRFLYPALARVNLLRTLLARMGVGMVLAVLSFLLAAQVEIAVRDVDPAPAVVRVFNGAPCAASVRLVLPHGELVFTLPAHTLYTQREPVPGVAGARAVAAHVNTSCTTPPGVAAFPTLANGASALLVVTAPSLALRQCRAASGVGKSLTGNARFAVVLAALPGWARASIALEDGTDRQEFPLAHGAVCSAFSEARYNAAYRVHVAGTAIASTVQVRRGGVYLLFVWRNGSTLGVTPDTATPFNRVNMLWQLPQIAAIAIGEIFFVVSGNELAYTHAPPSMRTLVRAGWGATRGLGSLLVIILQQLFTYDSVVDQFYLFSAILTADVLFFVFLARRYKMRAVDPGEVVEDEEEAHAMAVAQG